MSTQPTHDNATPVPADTLREWAMRCFSAAGMARDDAVLLADSLVQTSLWGIDSHGVALLPHYLDRLANGTIRARPNIQTERTGPATAMLHADQGHGIVMAHCAMSEAVRIAGEQGVGAVGVRNSSHCGAIGLYTRAAARQGCVGFAFTHANSVAVPHGGQRAFFGTNPISFAFPRDGHEPLCLDMATTSIPWNRVRNARREGHALPPDVAVDAQGAPTTDAQKAAAVVPLGGSEFGHKGYALALVIDLLCGPCSATRTDRTFRRCSRPWTRRGSSARFSSRSIRRASAAAPRCRRRSKPWRVIWRTNPDRRACRAILKPKSPRNARAAASPSKPAWPSSSAPAACDSACPLPFDLHQGPAP